LARLLTWPEGSATAFAPMISAYRKETPANFAPPVQGVAASFPGAATSCGALAITAPMTQKTQDLPLKGTAADSHRFVAVPACLGPDEPAFPALLAPVRPRVRRLWVWGRHLPSPPALAVVGARKASGLGCDFAREVARVAAREGVEIVSGGAYGIDAAAHEGALQSGARTHAVLGCGIDVVYPDRHQRLYAAIRRQGMLLSEYGPSVAPRPGQFPARNRLVAALSRAVVVVEAAARSGALVTARLADEMGVRVLAKPGSPGTDALLSRGRADAVRAPEDVFAALSGAVLQAGREDSVGPAGTCAVVVDAVSRGHKSVDAVASATGLAASEVMAALTEAELQGWVLCAPGNLYEVIFG